PLGNLAHQDLALVVPRHDGRRGARTLFVDDGLGILALHDGDHAVRGTQVNAVDLTHGTFLFACASTDALSPDHSRAGAARCCLSGGLSLIRRTLPRGPNLTTRSEASIVAAWNVNESSGGGRTR